MEECYLCMKNLNITERSCEHQTCSECTYVEDDQCLECGLRLDLVQMLECNSFTTLATTSTPAKTPFEFTLNGLENIKPTRRSSVTKRSASQDTEANTQELEDKDDEDDVQSQKKVVPKQDVKPESCKKQGFVCHFHGGDIISKHLSKNKFYCELCHVNADQVQPQTLQHLREDLMQLAAQVEQERVEIGFDLYNLLKLEQIQSKTVMVLNVKIEQARIAHDLFLPQTDGKGPISRLNLRRLKIDRARKIFGLHRPEDNKLYRWINDLCREQSVGPKAKHVDAACAYEMAKNVSDHQKETWTELTPKIINGKISMLLFKDILKKLIKVSLYEL